jgi:hypothetical protein
MLSRVRSVLQSTYPGTWKAELMSCFGSERWSELVTSAQRAYASGVREASPADEFDYLGVAEFHAIVARHFPLLFPTLASLSPEAREDGKRAVQRRLKSIKDVRDAVAHRTSADLSVLDALTAIAEMRRILRHVSPESVQRLDELMSQVLASLAPTPPPVAEPRLAEPRPVGTPADRFWQMWMELETEEFVLGLIRFMQDLGDSFDSIDEGEEDKWHWGRGPEKVALALQELLLGTTDRFTYPLEHEGNPPQN